MNFLLSAMAVQWGILTVEFFHRAYLGNWDVINMDIKLLIGGDFAAGALMISFGAVLGKVSATQLVVMTFCEMIVYGINETMVIHRLHAIDMGGSMVIHAFGCVAPPAAGARSQTRTHAHPNTHPPIHPHARAQGVLWAGGGVDDW